MHEAPRRAYYQAASTASHIRGTRPFTRILKRDASSYLNVPGGFTPILPSATPGDFTVADLVIFAGVSQP